MLLLHLYLTILKKKPGEKPGLKSLLWVLILCQKLIVYQFGTTRNWYLHIVRFLNLILLLYASFQGTFLIWIKNKIFFYHKIVLVIVYLIYYMCGKPILTLKKSETVKNIFFRAPHLIVKVVIVSPASA